ncbi:MAG: cyclopropane-fatty-acyl-phospholipid synthase, partial [Verrucomicrobia bacterium]
MISYGREETVSLIRVVVRNRRRYSRPRASMLPSIAQLTRAAEGVFIVEDVKNIGPNYDPTLLAWEENFRRAWPRFA